MRRARAAVAVIGAVILAVALSVQFTGILDGERDWLTTRAAWDGHGAFRSIGDLVEHYGSPHMGRDGVHPRLPGAFLLLAPLALVPVGGVALAWGLVSGLLLAGLVWWLTRHLGIPDTFPVWLVVVIVSPLLWSAFQSGSGSVLFAGLLIGTALLVREGRPAWAGAAFASAVTLKLFPILLVPVLLVASPLALAWASVIFVALNVVGLLLPGVTLTGSTASVLASSGEWWGRANNRSISALLHDGFGVPMQTGLLVSAFLGSVAILVLAWVARREGGFLPAWTASMAVMIAVIPYSWSHYDVVLIAAPLLLAARWPDRTWWWMALAVLGFWGWAPNLMGVGADATVAISRVAVLLAMGWMLVGPQLSTVGTFLTSRRTGSPAR